MIEGGAMRPLERQETGEQDLFRSRLDQIIDLTHALVKLLRAIDWRRSSDRSIRMAPAARHCRPGMAGLTLLKHMYGAV
jgi:transposase, IS5 family